MAHGDVTHLEIPVGNISRAQEFYSDLFGWDIRDFEGYEGYPMWRAPNQISGGALTPREEGFTQPRSVVEVDSIEEVLGKVEAAGGRVVAPKAPISDTSWYAVFSDVDGNVIGLYEGSTGG